jgi:hypothetical protein
MTDSASLAPSRSLRSTRKPRRPRAAAADGGAPSRTAARPAGAEARTLDLFGMPVDDVPPAAGAGGAASEADDARPEPVEDGRQGNLAGFEAPVAGVEVMDVAVAVPEAVRAGEGDALPDARVADPATLSVAPVLAIPDPDDATREAASADLAHPAAEVAAAPASARVPTSRRTTTRRAPPTDGAADGAPPATAPKRRSPRASTRGAADAAPVQAVAPDATITPAAAVTPAPASVDPSALAPAAPTADVMDSASLAAAPDAQPTQSVPPPAVDIDAHLRPLADRIRALQIETVELRRMAGAEMRRVNRLLLALAVLVLVGIGGLVSQAMTVTRLKHETVALQQRVDRLTAAQETQQANLITLTQRQDEQGAQVERLTNRLSQAARPVAKPVPHHARSR